jgi:hypothetical protein
MRRRIPHGTPKRQCENCPTRSRHCRPVEFGEGSNRKKLLLCPECVAAVRRIYKDQELIYGSAGLLDAALGRNPRVN